MFICSSLCRFIAYPAWVRFEDKLFEVFDGNGRSETGFSSSTSVFPVHIILLMFKSDFPPHSTRYQWEIRTGTASHKVISGRT